jgi:hypothetical protein
LQDADAGERTFLTYSRDRRLKPAESQVNLKLVAPLSFIGKGNRTVLSYLVYALAFTDGGLEYLQELAREHKQSR